MISLNQGSRLPIFPANLICCSLQLLTQTNFFAILSFAGLGTG